MKYKITILFLIMLSLIILILKQNEKTEDRKIIIYDEYKDAQIFDLSTEK